MAWRSARSSGARWKAPSIIFATVRESGKPAGEVLAGVLPDLIGSIPWPRAMRWNPSNVPFGRPLRWIVALLDDMVVPFVFAGVPSGRTSRGLRSAGSPEFEVPRAGEYRAALDEQGIVPSVEGRKAQIWEQVQALAAEVGGTVPQSAGGDLLDEVANLIEQPTPIRGSFDEAYLALPREVLVTVMRKHQRYFPVEAANGQGNGTDSGDHTGSPLLPYFVTVANGEVDETIVRHNNGEVLRARYADAQFFWKQDTRQALEAFRPRLATLTFEATLGSMLDKSERLAEVVPALGPQLGLNEAEQEAAARAAHLSKADLVTEMVMDFTSLQGIMGRHYARRGGESEAIANALEEQYSNAPASLPGLALGLVDRLDSLVGLFAVGKAPKATTDPFAQRRAAIGVVELLATRGLRFDLRGAVERVAAVQPVEVSKQARQEVLDFIQRRLEQWLLDQGYPHDVVQAAIAARGSDPAGALETAEQLAAVVEGESFQATLTAFARPARITRGKSVQDQVNPALFEHEEEHGLWKGYSKAALVLDEQSDFNALLQSLDELRPTIDAFFEKVFVMAEDEAVRGNRLALLQRVAALPRGIADLSQVRGF